MKWFKHFSDNNRGQSMQALLDELGHTGLCYYPLVEMCAEKLEQKDKERLTEADCLFRFHQRIVRQNLRISWVKLQRLLGICQGNGLLSFEFSGSTLTISMPILLDLLDRDSKNARQRRVLAAAKTRLDIEKEKEERAERGNEAPRALSNHGTRTPIDAPNTADAVSVPAEFDQILQSKKVSKEIQDSWIATYQDREWIQFELNKALTWILANKRKAPKKDFARFFSNWLSRGWESHRKNLKPEPVQSILCRIVPD